MRNFLTFALALTVWILFCVHFNLFTPYMQFGGILIGFTIGYNRK